MSDNKGMVHVRYIMKPELDYYPPPPSQKDTHLKKILAMGQVCVHVRVCAVCVCVYACVCMHMCVHVCVHVCKCAYFGVLHIVCMLVCMSLYAYIKSE